MVLPASHKVSRAPWYSGSSSNEPNSFRLQGSHLLWLAFPNHSTKNLVFDSSTAPQCRQMKSYNPLHTTLTGLTYTRFELFPFRSPLLRESRLISTPAGTEMFHFPAFTFFHLCIQRRIDGINRLGCPIRESPDHSLLAAYRGLSQLATPFIVS